MDQKQKNDSKTNSPIPEIAAGCSIAGLVVVAAVWLILETFYFLNYFSDPEAGGHNLRELSWSPGCDGFMRRHWGSSFVDLGSLC